MISKILLWLILILGIALFIFSLRRPPLKDWLLAFAIAAYFAVIIGSIVQGIHLVEYPITFLKEVFPSSLLFESLIFPVVNIYFYQTTYRSSVLSILVQGVLYTSALTIGEVILEKYTSLIEYIHWKWFITFVTVFCFLLAVRFLLKLINRESK